MPSEASSPLGARTGTEAGLAGEANEFRTTEGDDTWSGRQEGTCCEVSVTLWWLHGSWGGGGGQGSGAAAFCGHWNGLLKVGSIPL